MGRKRKAATGADAITVRRMPEPVVRAVRERAVAHGVSLNRAVISLLEEATVATPAPRRHDDMDHLFGALSAAGAAAMEQSVAEARPVRPEDWA